MEYTTHNTTILKFSRKEAMGEVSLSTISESFGGIFDFLLFLFRPFLNISDNSKKFHVSRIKLKYKTDADSYLSFLVLL